MAKTAQPLRFDFSTCRGRNRINRYMERKLTKQVSSAQARLKAEVNAGELGFWKLPNTYLNKKTIAPVQAAARRVQRDFDNLVLIGIGGSALGARMLQNALCHRYHNEAVTAKGKGVRLYLLENDDPKSFSDLMGLLDLSRTCFNVISKSGSTVETISQFALVMDRLKKEFPNSWKKHLLFTTDPKSGKLRELADQEGIDCLDVPSDVGGRYSVLSPVGLFPALVLGADAKALLKGAQRMAKRCLSSNPEENPALLGAMLHVVADQQLSKNMVVAFPYSDQLRDWTEWFCQLWAESLGKNTDNQGRPVQTGTTPIKTLGAIDQHSQMQLYMEGPDDKLFMFLRVESFKTTLPFPPKKRLHEPFQYLAGHSMQELIQAEQTASRFALREQKRLTYQITLDRVDADALGQLIFWAEAMTVYAGYLYDINPFDQPGVELGKKFAYGLMGREGFESYRKKIEKSK